MVIARCARQQGLQRASAPDATRDAELIDPVYVCERLEWRRSHRADRARVVELFENERQMARCEHALAYAHTPKR